MSHGARTNTFPNIVVHVGLKVQLQLLLIDLTSFLEIRTQLPLDLTLNQSLIAKLVAHAMVETLQEFMTMLTSTVSLIQVVNSTLPPTLTPVIPSTSAETAHGLLLLPTKLA